MTIQIGETIARLRREKGVTQEQLAQAVGVSAPAVSKWETGQSCPDIALLPPLARYFDVTVDTLLAYVPAMTDDMLDAQAKAVEDAFARDGWAAGLALCEALLREYPTDVPLRILLASQLMQGKAVAPDEAARAEGSARQIRWLEEASAIEGPMQLMARNLLGTFYLSAGRLDDAEATLTPLLEYQPDTPKLMPTLRMLQGRYDDAAKLAQQSLLSDAHSLVTDLGTLAGICRKQGDMAASARYVETAEAVVQALGLPRFFRMTLAQDRLSLADAQRDGPALLNALEEYVDALLEGLHIDDSPLLSHLTPEREAHRPAHERAIFATLARELAQGEPYAIIRDEPRFAALLDRLGGAALP